MHHRAVNFAAQIMAKKQAIGKLKREIIDLEWKMNRSKVDRARRAHQKELAQCQVAFLKAKRKVDIAHQIDLANETLENTPGWIKGDPAENAS